MVGKECKICKKRMKGRSDKLFCSTKCKNDYHYQKRSSLFIVNTIDKILHKNYEILLELLENDPRKYFKVPKTLLTEMGYNFDYYTSTYINSRGKMYFYVYDCSIMEFRNQEIMIVNNQHKKNKILFQKKKK